MAVVEREVEQEPRTLDAIYDDAAEASLRLRRADEALRTAEQEQADAYRAVRELQSELRVRNAWDIQARMNGDS